MIIGIDIRSLVEGKQSGVEEYTINLLENLFKIDSKNEYRLFCNAYKAKSLNISIFNQYKNVKIYKYNWPNKILNLSFRILNYPKIDKMLGGVDLFFAPNIMFFGLSGNCKLILTIHDLSYEYYKNFLTFYRRFWHKFLNPKGLAEKADKIICPSYSTKSDLVKTYGIPAGKIEVIYSGLSDVTRGDLVVQDDAGVIRKKYNLPEKFILFLGTFEPRKNIIGIISAYKMFNLRCYTPYKLVLAGSGGWKNKKIFEKIKKEGLEKDIVLSGHIDSNDKQAVLSLASLFIYPSFYEGFGFPPLEAMQYGVPVITSACSSLLEIVGKAALLVNPYNIEEIAQAMYQVLSDEKLREGLIKRGYEQAKKFKWEKTARRTLGIFKEIAKKPER
ncbi:MAG: glycosyltransferase family 1 protein [Patescibacteria group bacterium]